MAPPAKNVVVVGGGVIGLSVAYYALQKGHHVIVLERGAADHDCCSRGNAGLVVPSHFTPLAAPGMVGLGLRMALNPRGPFAIAPRPSFDLARWCWLFSRAATAPRASRAAVVLRDLSLLSRSCFDDLADRFQNEIDLVRNGLIMLCKTQAALDEEAVVAKHALAMGIEARVLSATGVAALDPDIRVDVAGGVYFPQDCSLSPTGLMVALSRAVQERGGTIRHSLRATGWQTRGDRIDSVRTPTGMIRGDEFVVACGAWSADLVRSLGLRLPLEAGRGYSLTLPSPPRMPRVCCLLMEARVAVTPMGSQLRFAGTLEIAGLRAAVNQRRAAGMVAAIPRYLPDFNTSDFAGIRAWVGLRPCSPDGLPYVGRFARYSNLSAATGHAMLGVSLAPVTGKLVAEIVSDEAPSLSVEALRPDRYG